MACGLVDDRLVVGAVHGGQVRCQDLKDWQPVAPGSRSTSANRHLRQRYREHCHKAAFGEGQPHGFVTRRDEHSWMTAEATQTSSPARTKAIEREEVLQRIIELGELCLGNRSVTI
jgi:hypothetical protein